MAEQASDYHRGDQDIRDQQATFHLFIAMTKWTCVYLGALVLFLAMWLSAKTGLMPALITAVVVIVLGTLLLRDRGGSDH